MRRIFVALSAAAVLAAATQAGQPTAQAATTSASLTSFADVIDRTGTPATADNGAASSLSPFADQGSYHGYGLPAPGDSDSYGGFTGPWYMAQEFPWFMSKALSRVRLTDAATGKPLPLPAPVAHSYPGRLTQRYTVDGVTLDLTLRFAAQHTALVVADVSSTELRKLKVSWTGEILRPADEPAHSALGVVATSAGMEVRFSPAKGNNFYADGAERFAVHHAEPVNSTVTGDSYVTTRTDPLEVSTTPTRMTWAESFTFTDQERANETAAVSHALSFPDSVAKDGDSRWQGYLDRAVHGVAPPYQRLAVKAVETLVGNWRGPGGRNSYGGIVPSMSHRYYAGGYWPWDMFKEAVGTAKFSPSLAKSVVQAEFEHQITAGNETGMLPDVVGFRDPATGTGHSNLRNTKPPLAGWAVWEIYQTDGDQNFLNEIYTKLVAEHDWWLRNRDHDRNGVLEYGATTDPANSTDDAARTAAAWESGMDSEPRFDPGSGLTVLHNTDADGKLIGYSLNQESVDLNAFMARNDRSLAKIAAVLGKTTESASFTAQATNLDQKIRTTMWDPATGYFYDTRTGTGKPYTSTGKGIEGMVPLFSGSATSAQADVTRRTLLDPEQFNTFIPFPPIPKNHPAYQPGDYTRGSAWPDQVAFGITGLETYGFAADADTLRTKLLTNSSGLLNGDEPIWEKYNSATGEGVNTGNFSWSAAGILTLLRKGAGPITSSYGKCADVQNSASADGTPLQHYTCNHTAAQQWTHSIDGSLKNTKSGRCQRVGPETPILEQSRPQG